jgi:hypothetical protein
MVEAELRRRTNVLPKPYRFQRIGFELPFAAHQVQLEVRIVMETNRDEDQRHQQRASGDENVARTAIPL